MKSKIVIRIILIILIILWMLMIFSFSAQDGGESSGLSRKIALLFTKDEAKLEIIIPWIRKLAHFSEYGLGGVLTMSLMLTFENIKNKWKVISSSLFCIAYAGIDEWHQLYVPGRSGMLRDVYIDSLGVIVGVLVTLLIVKIIQAIRK